MVVRMLANHWKQMWADLSERLGQNGQGWAAAFVGAQAANKGEKSK